MKIGFENIAYTLIGILYIFGFTVFIPVIYGIEGEISGKILVWYIVFPRFANFNYYILLRIQKPFGYVNDFYALHLAFGVFCAGDYHLRVCVPDG